MEILFMKKKPWIFLFPSKQGTPAIAGPDTAEPYISVRGPSSKLAFCLQSCLESTRTSVLGLAYLPMKDYSAIYLLP